MILFHTCALGSRYMKQDFYSLETCLISPKSYVSGKHKTSKSNFLFLYHCCDLNFAEIDQSFTAKFPEKWKVWTLKKRSPKCCVCLHCLGITKFYNCLITYIENLDFQEDTWRSLGSKSWDNNFLFHLYGVLNGALICQVVTYVN